MFDFITNLDASFIFWLMLLHCLIGLTAAIIADQKGYSFVLWLIIGLMGGTFGLIFALSKPLKSN